MRLHLLPLTLLSLLTPAVIAVPVLSAPAATLAAGGTINVAWTDDGTAPGLRQFESYTLTLYVGGNLPTNSKSLVAIGDQTGSLTAGSVSGTIPTTITAPLANGFYFQMIATAKEGGTVTAYSTRFSISGLVGTAESAAIRNAVTALGGATTGPADVNGVVSAAPVPPAADPADTAPVAGAFGVPYAQQNGPTKYAPMQGVPPTKITIKKFTPLFPTSAYTVATTWLPRPTVLTTMTESQTFSAKASINSAAPQSQPTANDMQKFLNRWKD